MPEVAVFVEGYWLRLADSARMIFFLFMTVMISYYLIVNLDSYTFIIDAMQCEIQIVHIVPCY